MRKLMPKFRYTYNHNTGEWTDPDGNVIPDSEIDEAHLKIFLGLTKGATKRRLSNIANVRAKH